MKPATRVTMDPAGRLVLPKKIREEAGIEPGMPLEIRVDEGRIEIEPAYLEVKVEKKGLLHVAVPLEPVEPLTNELVRETQRALRERRRP